MISLITVYYLDFLRRFLDHLRMKHLSLKKFPDLIQIRWGCWIKCVLYLDEYINEIFEFLNEELNNNNFGEIEKKYGIFLTRQNFYFF